MWNEVTPDPRPFKPGMPKLYPVDETLVAVEIPLTREYIWNAQDIIQAQLGMDSREEPDPILTPAGMKYAISQLENAMRDTEKTNENWNDDDDFTEAEFSLN